MHIANECGYLKMANYDKMDVLNSSLETPDFTRKELKILLKRAYIEFYFSFNRILYTIRNFVHAV